MKKGMKIITCISLTATVLWAGLYCLFPYGVFLSLAITFGTVFYHFIMRLLVGYAVNALMQNHADPDQKWYRQRSFEQKLYAALKVKKWKRSMPTYDPSLFSPAEHTPEEIIQAMCQAEVVHEIIVVLSFLPLAFSLWFDSFGVFLITSLLSACFDLMFVIMQRYNRPRLRKIIERNERNHGI